MTGGSISNIDGLIKAQGSANLFLINPNGIIFGANAQLDIGGSFLATTANRLNFADGNFFSAIDHQVQPLLTLSVPIGLQFGETAGRIVNQSGAEDSRDFPTRFQVQPSKTIGLVGGEIFLYGGRLFAPGGRIELGSVAGPTVVELTPVTTGWTLVYEGVQNFQDIQLSQEAGVDTTGERSGDIQLRGRRIVITEDSQVTGVNYGANLGGTLALKASEFVEVSGSSELNTRAFSTGTAADITIEARRLVVRDGSFIDTASNSDGRGGNITVEASESVEIDGNGLLTQITTQAFVSGNAGDVKVKTGRLALYEGGQISSSTRNAGNGGAVIVEASESVEVGGQGETLEGRVVDSGLFARTIGLSATGSGGRLEINTGHLLVQEGGSISVAAVNSSTGQAGSLNINASNSVEISGIGSTVLAESESPKPAGNLTINTDKWIVRDGAEVGVSSRGSGNAGNLEVTAGSFRLENNGRLTATSVSGEGGNIRLQGLNLLLLRDQSEIATDARGGEGNGGNINIDTNVLVGLEDSDITATAIGGRGGNIQINTEGIFGIEPRDERTPESDITASSELGVDGIVEINRPETDPSADLVVLPAEIVDVGELVAQGCSVGGGNLARGTSEFVVTGRGGVPPTPAEATRSEPVLVDLGLPVQSAENRASAAISTNNLTSSESAPLVEATGWVRGPQGEIILTAQAPNITPEVPWLTPTSCKGS